MRRRPVVQSVVAVLVLVGCAGEPSVEEAEAPPPQTLASPVVEETPVARGQAVAVEGGSYTDLDVSELQAFLEEEDPPLVNVHIPFEGDLPGTDLSIPYDQIQTRLEELPADRDAPVVLYCRSGRMSAIAAADLARLGYSNVYNLVGGFISWRAAGLPMANP